MYSTCKREVYRNLRFKDETVYSVRRYGLVEGHATVVVMDGNEENPVKFAVGSKGNQRVRDEKSKNVHAVIRGNMVRCRWTDGDERWCAVGDKEWRTSNASDAVLNQGYIWKQVTYNPYKYKTFVTVDDEKPIYSSPMVTIGEEVWALVPGEEQLLLFE